MWTSLARMLMLVTAMIYRILPALNEKHDSTECMLKAIWLVVWVIAWLLVEKLEDR